MSSSSASSTPDWNARWVQFSKKHVSHFTFDPTIVNPFDVPEDKRATTLVIGESTFKGDVYSCLCTAADACEAKEKIDRGVPKEKVFLRRAELQTCFGRVGDFPMWSMTGNFKNCLPTSQQQSFHPTKLDKAKRAVRLSINGSGCTDLVGTHDLVVDGVNCGPVITQMLKDLEQLQRWQDELVNVVYQRDTLRAGLGVAVMQTTKSKAKAELARLKARKEKTAEDLARIDELNRVRGKDEQIYREVVRDMTTNIHRASLQKRQYVRDRPHVMEINGDGPDDEPLEVPEDAHMSVKCRVTKNDTRKGQIARMDAARLVGQYVADHLPEGVKLWSPPMYEHLEGNDDIRAFRPLAETERDLHRGDLVSAAFTVSVYAGPKAFGFLPKVVGMFRLANVPVGNGSGQAVALGDQMGFLPYTAPSAPSAGAGEESQEVGSTGFGAGGWSNDFSSSASTRKGGDIDTEEQPSRKKFRGDSDDQPMDDA